MRLEDVVNIEGASHTKRDDAAFQEILIWLDKEQIEYLNTIANPSKWIRKAIDEKQKREKANSCSLHTRLSRHI
jgi:hypothetical protein